MDRDKALKEAKYRGKDRGEADAQVFYHNPEPLSGEWAGESIPELLGDLLDSVETVDEQDGFDLLMELCDAYEEGYSEANPLSADID